MKGEKKKVYDLSIRYLILLALSLFAIPIIYLIFLPLTKYPVFYFLDLLYPAFLKGSLIFIYEKVIDIAPACVAGSAYYLLFVLNLGTPGIKSYKRVKMIVLSFLAFLILNVLRIVFLGILFVNGSPYFDIFHKILWYAGSTIIVVAIWFTMVKLFKVKEIPFYSDLKYLYLNSALKRNRRRK